MIKYAIVEIKGGLGNQIFQYSFAKYLENVGQRPEQEKKMTRQISENERTTNRKFKNATGTRPEKYGNITRQ